MADVVNSGELIHRRAEVCQKIVEEALENKYWVEVFLEKLREVGATPTEASDYGRQNTDQLETGSLTPGTDSGPVISESTSEHLNNDQQTSFREA